MKIISANQRRPAAGTQEDGRPVRLDLTDARNVLTKR